MVMTNNPAKDKLAKNKSLARNKYICGGSPGFTLIEAVVASALFATVVVSMMGTYVYTLRVNKKTDAIRTATDNARFISDFFSKEIRNGKIDYNPVSGVCAALPQSPDKRLGILNVSGDHECFLFRR